MMDWDDWGFKASGWTALNQAATEHDALHNKGGYYWELGDGAKINHLLPETFLDGHYTFELSCAALPYELSWGTMIQGQRTPDVFNAQQFQNLKKLSEGSSGNFEVSEDDGETVMLTFDVTDENGNAINLEAGLAVEEEPT